MISRYPLCWPSGWKRAQQRRNAKFLSTSVSYVEGGIRRAAQKPVTINDATNRILVELGRLGVKNVRDDVVISTNLPLNLEGRPRGDKGEPSDPGVAVYWERKGVAQCMAIDQYTRVADNLAAVAATLEALRAIERHGGAEILNRAFTGFAALPERAGISSWRDILGLGEGRVTLADVEAAFRKLAFDLHPDRGGDANAFVLLNQARENARRELEAK